MNTLIISILSFMAVICLGGSLVLLLGRRSAAVHERLQKLGHAQGGRSLATTQAQLTGWLSRLGQASSFKGTSSKLSRTLAQAGLYQPSAATLYLGAKVALLILGVVGLSVAQALLKLEFSLAMLMIFGGTVLLFFIPNVYLFSRRSRHCTEIRHHLPDAVDLLEICVSSGMGLDMAWNLVADEIRQVSPRLADEMALTNMEIHLGVPRADAMRHMTERTGAEELTSLVAVLVQSERFGTSISEVLRIFATTMRDLRSQRAEEAAEKMAVKLLFPMVLFIFPAILIVAVGPACIIIAQVMGGQ